MSRVIIASGDLETIFAEGFDGEVDVFTLTSRCNACGHEESSSWAQDETLAAVLLEDGRAEGQRTADAMFAHILEKHPEKVVPKGL